MMAVLDRPGVSFATPTSGDGDLRALGRDVATLPDTNCGMPLSVTAEKNFKSIDAMMMMFGELQKLHRDGAKVHVCGPGPSRGSWSLARRKSRPQA